MDHISILNQKFTKIILVILFLFEFVSVCVSINYIENLNIESHVSPEDNMIWVPDSGKSPNQATITLMVTNPVSVARPPLDVILAIDNSASLRMNDPNREIIYSSKLFIDTLDPNYDRVGIVNWSDYPRDILPLTSNMTEAKASLDNSVQSGDTCIGAALEASWNLLKSARPSAKKVIILLSDGNNLCKYDKDFITISRNIRESGIDIYTIGFGSANIADLAAIGTYYHSRELQQISNIFRDIAAGAVGSINNTKIDYMIPNGIDVDIHSYRIVSSLFPSNTDNDYFNYNRVVYMDSLTGDKVLTWVIGSMLPKETKFLDFKISSKVPGTYYLGKSASSSVKYTTSDGINRTQNISAVKIIVMENERDINSVYYASILVIFSLIGYLLSNRILRRRD